MQAAIGPPRGSPEIHPYTPGMPRKPHASKGPRPKQGAHLLALRKAAGLTQIELARFLAVPHANIAFWEWSDKPPRSGVLPKMAKAFGVRVEQLLIESAQPLSKHSGPVGEVQRTFERVRRLPRKQQRKVLEIVQALVNEFDRKAG